MRISSLLSPAGRATIIAANAPYLLLFSVLCGLSGAVTFTSIPQPDLDLSQLGRVGLAGDFDGISLYQFQGQNENGFNTNGSQSILAQFPTGGFATLASSDAGIKAMCNFIEQDGTMAGVIVAGNFTSLGGIESQGVAMFNPNTSTVTPLPGISGQVSALLCDQSSNTVYVGGSFRAANSTNAIAWVGNSGWSNLPFLGFNGPVTSITKTTAGHIIFGGSFTGLGNASTPNEPDQQVINISGANITAGSSSTTTGFSDPKNIVCKTNGTDGAGNTWLLADNTPGFWRADFGFGFQPTKLRLWNTHQDGRGTQTWRFTALPINGIMNFTYNDPVTGALSTCTSECPLSNNASIPFQDFHFVNVIGMDAFRIDISAFYGSGGGLNGVELFENDIYAYAINSFNEPSCVTSVAPSNATSTGPWDISPSLESVSEYLTATLTGPTINSDSASVVFFPDIKQSGNYSVNMYTPGCVQDSTCSSRGQVNITGVMSNGANSATFQTQIFQTNNFDKYDQIYFGFIEAGTSSFRPSVTISPSSVQSTNLTVVAQRVGFTLINSSGGLNSVFEWDPTQASVNTSDFTSSSFDQVGMTFGQGAGVNAMVTSGQNTFIGGNYSTPEYDNILGVNGTGTFSLAGGGLNAAVVSMYLNGSTLYVGGNFTNTSRTSVSGLNGIAVYDTSANAWSPLGAGVNGQVFDIVPISINVTANTPETVISVTGNFDQILAFGNNQSVSVSGFAIWVPSRKNWLSNLDVSTGSINGQISASVVIPGGSALFAGSLSSSQLGSNGAATLSSSSLGSFPIKIQQSQTQSASTLSKRASSNQTISGVIAGYFYESGGRNVTILGGHFTAQASNGSSINNLAFINGSNSDTVTGVGPSLSTDSTVMALTVQSDTLFVGGDLAGTVNGASINGLLAYNLLSANFPTQPPALSGSDVVVHALATRPNTGDVYVGGNFDSAGSLGCPGVCYFTTSAAQWNRPGSTLQGVANTLTWASADSLIVGGSLIMNNTNVSLATYNAQSQTWSAFNGASAIPGPVTALTSASSDTSQIWVAGTATNGSTFLMKYDGSSWKSAGNTLGASTSIKGLQVLSLSQDHDSSDLVPSSQTLMLTGSINLPNFGNASAVLFNGTTFQPFALTTGSGSSAGSISQIFSQQQMNFSSSGGHLALGLVVLIGLAIALAVIFLIVIAGIIAERIRRRREGYIPAPTNMFDKTSQMSRIPPEQIFGTLGQRRNPPPTI